MSDQQTLNNIQTKLIDRTIVGEFVGHNEAF